MLENAGGKMGDIAKLAVRFKSTAIPGAGG